MKDGSLLKVSRDMKHVILEKLAEAMCKYMSYPADYHFCHVAAALIKSHPCLSEPGSQSGYCAWKNSLKFKMGNFCTKLWRSGIADVCVNGNRRGRDFPDGDPSSSNIKRPKRSETNFFPNFPDGQNAVSLEKIRIELEMESKNNYLMLLVWKRRWSRHSHWEEERSWKSNRLMVERWPALFTVTQVSVCVCVCTFTIEFGKWACLQVIWPPYKQASLHICHWEYITVVCYQPHFHNTDQINIGKWGCCNKPFTLYTLWQDIMPVEAWSW